MNIKKMTFILVMCGCMHGLYAQRHYAGVSALELNYGQNIFGSNNHNASLSFSKYRNRTTFWKIGLNYLKSLLIIGMKIFLLRFLKSEQSVG